MRKVLILLLITTSASAQKKDFSFEQIFRGAPSNIFKPLPSIGGWVDDTHYIEDGKSVDVKTGKSVAYTGRNMGIVTPPELPLEGARNITYSPDGKWMAFTRHDNNLYIRETATGREKQLTTDGSETVYNGYASWVYYEEILGRASQYKAFWWSPDSKSIAYMRFDDSQVPVFPIYNSEGQYGFLENTRYPKAGDKNPEVKVGVVSLNDEKTIWTDFNEKDDQYFGTPLWTPNGKLWVQWMPRRQNSLKIYEIDKSTGNKKELYNERQKTWINLDDDDRITFLPDGKTFLLKSDKSGWRHLYWYDINGNLLSQVTNGDYSVDDLIKIDDKTNTVYFMARKENSARRDFYKVNLTGKDFTRLSFGEYTHNINLSPGGNYFITTYSNLTTPPKMALVNAKGKILRELGDSKGPEFYNYNLPQAELVRVKSEDGIFDLPMIITYPTHFDPAKKYPVLISVYGGPNAGTVYDTWKGVGAPAWWAQEGIIQVAMDNRSSGHFGKNGMNYIYRQLGKWEIEDYMTCGRWLKQQVWVDSNKLCITGGSFGGYLTCMALTYGADVFNYGIANYSVTDWQLYDTHYTERFMDTPQENPEGYRITSVMTYAKKYKGLLRIVHGTMDDNVHIQNSIQLVNRLENLGKHFEFMIYPGERHGWGGAKSRHSMQEAYRFYYRNLLDKDLPNVFGQ